MLTHLRASCCKVITREKTESKETFMQPWTSLSHKINFGRYFNKHQKFCKYINIPISDTNKILLFLVQIYASKHFTEEDMMKYEMIPNNDNRNWNKMLANLTKIYATRKA